MRDRATVVDSGCWIWSGMASKQDYPYPVVRHSGKQLLVHRVVLEAKHGAPLGSQAAHHKCAVSMCVNPDHLEPATHADNILEMISRRSYLARIAELEDALRLVDPSHPLLAHIGCA